MQPATWRARAARGAGVPEGKLRRISESSVGVDLYMDGLTSLSLTLYKIISVRDRDGYTVVQQKLVLTCKVCSEELYQTHDQVQLEDLTAARSTGQLHLGECKPDDEADATVDTAPTSSTAAPSRTYCD